MTIPNEIAAISTPIAAIPTETAPIFAKTSVIFIEVAIIPGGFAAILIWIEAVWMGMGEVLI